ncbi:MAG: acyltransferase [Steroidobacteraceae bacterium]
MRQALAAEAGRHRLGGVDVLRGLCVLLVTLHHIHLRFWINDYDVDGVLPRTLNQLLFWSGYYAVIAFFVISGFLITGLSMRRWGELGRIHVGRFYRMRAARILPSLLLLLLVLSALHLAGAPEFTIPPERASLAQALWSALTFHLNWLEGRRGYLPGDWDVLWSLSIEETFYLLFPLACRLLRREALLLLPLGCLLILGPVNRTVYAGQDPWGQYAYLSCMDAIAFGALAALALGAGVGNSSLSAGTGWLRAVGRSSYEIYLFHMLVVLGLIGLFKQWKPSLSMIPLWYLAMLLLSISIGVALFRYYSEPLNLRLRARGAHVRTGAA